MKKAAEDQIYELLKQSSAVLIALPSQPTTDAIASGLAVLAVLEKLGKRGRVVSSGFQLPQNHSFLPKSTEIFDDLSAVRQFIISVDVSKTSVEELSYAIEGDKLQIHLSPKDGFFKPEDVTTSAGEYAFDCIVVLDAQDLEQLGRIYERNAEFFYHTPIINIDHSPANDNFGQVNAVTVTATSTSEIVFEIIKDWGEHILDEFIATNLLTGMISKTRSFKSGTVTPRSLAIASHLISQGARREEIVRHLYQSKKLSTLKLWGRALSKLEADFEHKVVWSTLTQQDFDETAATPEDLPDVIDELIINTPDAKHVLLLYPDNSGVHCVVSTAQYVHAQQTFADFAPTGTDTFARFTIHDRTIEQVRDELLKRLREVVAPMTQR